MHRNSGLYAAIGALTVSAAARAQCEYQWTSPFVAPDLNGAVRAIVYHDDGTGVSIFVAGDFTAAGNLPASRIARWDGRAWWPLGDGLNGRVVSMAVFDEDGAGPARPALFVCGDFTHAGDAEAAGIARWDGQNWSAVGGGAVGQVHTLAAATSPQFRGLYVGGTLQSVGGVPVQGIARWDGHAWSAVGDGLAGPVHAITEFDLGDGPAIFAGGKFGQTGGGVRALRIARWDGSSWAEFGGGILSNEGHVEALAGIVTAAGVRSLYVGGSFSIVAEGRLCSNFVRWESGQWRVAGDAPGTVHAIDVGSPGATNQVVAVGSERHAGDYQTGFLAHASGGASGGNGPIYAVATPPPGEQRPVLFGGDFTQSFGTGGPFIAQWGSDSGLEVAPSNGPQGNVRAMLPVRDESGSSLYVGGSFNVVDGDRMAGIARWNGREWSPLGPGLSGQVLSLIMFDRDGDGPEEPMLHALGRIFTAGSLPVNGIARWDGQSWHNLGSGLWGNNLGGFAYTAAVFDDGAGPALYVGGDFQHAGPHAALGLAKWNGTSWAPVGGGVEMYQPPLCMAVFDDDDDGPIPPALYVGGHFGTVGDPPMPVQRIARWDGTAWSDVGGGVDVLRTNLSRVTQLAVFDPDGDGPEGASLYVAGVFSGAAGIVSPGIVRWDGQAWHGVGGGVDPVGPFAAPITTMLARTDPDGPALYVCGSFTSAGGMPVRNIARWNGQTWAPVGDGAPDAISAAAFYAPDDQPEALFTGTTSRAGLHRWGPDLPTLVEHPAPLTLTSGQRACLYAAASAHAPLTIQWRRNGEPLADGGNISGATTQRLVISPVREADEGVYDAVFTNACGEITTDGAMLTVLCPADWNSDDAVTSADIADFLAAWLASLQAGDLATDFDGSGQVTSADISVFLTAWLRALTEGC